MRRIVTGHKNGKSVILEDSDIPSQENWGGEITRVWQTRGIPIVPLEEADFKTQILPNYWFPQVGETGVGITVLPPEQEVFAKYKEKREDLVESWRRSFADDLFMHTTDTVDYDVILAGELWIELDDGVEAHLKPGDCVVQNGTRHAWRNRGSENCVMVSFLVGAKRATTEYIDTANKFAFHYNKTWIKNAAAIAGNTVAFFSSAPYNCPGAVVMRFPESDAPTLKELLPRIFGAKSNPVTATDEKITNAHGTTANAHVLEYASQNGTRMDAKVYGFRSGSLWWVLYLYQAPTLGTLDGVMPDEVFNTWKFF